MNWGSERTVSVALSISESLIHHNQSFSWCDKKGAANFPVIFTLLYTFFWNFLRFLSIFCTTFYKFSTIFPQFCIILQQPSTIFDQFPSISNKFSTICYNFCTIFPNFSQVFFTICYNFCPILHKFSTNFWDPKCPPSFVAQLSPPSSCWSFSSSRRLSVCEFFAKYFAK